MVIEIFGFFKKEKKVFFFLIKKVNEIRKDVKKSLESK